MRRFHSHYGTGAEEVASTPIEHQTCPVCKALNAENQDWCSSCGTPLNTKSAIDTARQQGLVRLKEDAATRGELAQLKAELASSRKREDDFRKEQMLLLRQMQDSGTIFTLPRCLFFSSGVGNRPE